MDSLVGTHFRSFHCEIMHEHRASTSRGVAVRLPSLSWSSFTDPVVTEGCVGVQYEIIYLAVKRCN